MLTQENKKSLTKVRGFDNSRTFFATIQKHIADYEKRLPKIDIMKPPILWESSGSVLLSVQREVMLNEKERY